MCDDMLDQFVAVLKAVTKLVGTKTVPYARATVVYPPIGVLIKALAPKEGTEVIDSKNRAVNL